MQGKLSLKAARINAGLTQDALAQKLDVAPKTVSQWERGVGVRPVILFALAYVLHVNADIFRT